MDVRILGRSGVGVLEDVAPGVFDHALRPDLVTEFLGDPRHHLAVVLDGGTVVGFASALHYVHPDKPAELWINEVGVAPTHQRRGIGRQLMEALFSLGRELGCREAWVLTEAENDGAVGLYASLGGDATPSVMFTFKL